MEIELWLNRCMKNKDLYIAPIDTLNKAKQYTCTNKCIIDILFSRLVDYSKNMKYEYYDGDIVIGSRLFEKKMYNDFVEFCYDNT